LRHVTLHLDLVGDKRPCPPLVVPHLGLRRIADARQRPKNSTNDSGPTMRPLAIPTIAQHAVSFR